VLYLPGTTAVVAGVVVTLMIGEVVIRFSEKHRAY
jgi:hypothetical protein